MGTLSSRLAHVLSCATVVAGLAACTGEIELSGAAPCSPSSCGVNGPLGAGGGGAGSIAGSDDAGASGGGAASDAGMIADVDGGPAPDAGVNGLCPPEAGSIRPGARWSYTSHSTIGAGTESWTLTAVDQGASQVLLTYEIGSHWTPTGGAPIDQLTTVHRICDARGLTTTTEHVQVVGGMVTDSVFDPPYLLMGPVLKPGSSWMWSGSFTENGMSNAYNDQVSVTGQAAIDVPAGHFDTVVVQMDNPLATDTVNYAAGVGLVQDVIWVLTSYSP
jgi:hypothetical protein